MILTKVLKILENFLKNDHLSENLEIGALMHHPKNGKIKKKYKKFEKTP